MIVSELIHKLQELKQDQRIVTLGYEGGYCDIESDGIEELELILNYNKASSYGPHEIKSEVFSKDTHLATVPAYNIGR